MSDQGTQGAEKGPEKPILSDADIGAMWDEFQAQEDEAAARKRSGEDDPDAISTEGKVDDTESRPGGGQPPKGASSDGGGQESPKTPPAVAPTNQGASQPDIWANATPEQRAAYQASEAARQAAETGSRSNAGRIRQMQEELKHLKASVGRAADSSASTVSDTLEQGLAEFPEVAGPLKNALGQIEKQVADHGKALHAQIAAKEAEIADSIGEQAGILDGLVPNWESLYAKGGTHHQAYARWIQNEAPVKFAKIVQANNEHIVDAHSAAVVYKAFEAFRAAQNPPAETPAPGGSGQSQELSQRRSAQLDAAAHPQNTRRPPTLSSTPKDVDDAEAHWAELEANDPDEERYRARGARRR